MVQIAQRFEDFIETYRRSGGSNWSGRTSTMLQAASSPLLRHQPAQGQVRVPLLREAPSDTRAMGFPPQLWFEEGAGDGAPIEPPQEIRDIAGRLEHLFWVVKNQRTGQPCTNAGWPA